MIINPNDLLILKETLWPMVKLCDFQVDIIDSTLTCAETYVTAGNKLGKDFTAGLIAVGCFLICQARKLTCRIVTSSVAEKHLNVLWGEIGRYISTSRSPLFASQGGPLIVNSLEIRRREEAESKKPYNYLVGMVYDDPEKMAGHHAEFTLFIGDEASGLDDELYKRVCGWAKHKLFIGNPEACQNFFRKGVKGGNLLAV